MKSESPIVEVMITPTPYALRLEWGMPVDKKKQVWIWPRSELEVRLYLDKFPESLGTPELQNMPLSERYDAHSQSIVFVLPFAIEVSLGKEVTRSAFAPGTVAADAAGKYYPIHFSLSGDDIPHGGLICYPKVVWPLVEGWLAKPIECRVMFGYEVRNEFKVIHSERRTLRLEDLPSTVTPQSELEAAIRKLTTTIENTPKQPGAAPLSVTVGDIIGSTGLSIGIDNQTDVHRLDPYDLSADQADRLRNTVQSYFEARIKGLEERINELEGRPASDQDTERLHKRYLRRFFKPEFINVALAKQVTVPDNDNADLTLEKKPIRLTDVYVPLPVGLIMTVRVNKNDRRIIEDWWVEARRSEVLANEAMAEELRGQHLQEWTPLGVERADLEILVEDMQRQLNERKINITGRSLEYSWYIEAHTAAAIQPRLVLTGKPGSGKSSFAKHLAICMAGELLGDERVSGGVGVKTLGFWPAGVFTPVYISLHDLVETQFPNPTAPAGTAQFDAYIRSLLDAEDNVAFWPELRRKLEDGEAIILLDGLDEVPGAVSDERRMQIQSFVSVVEADYGLCRFIITSRPYAYNDSARPWTLTSFRDEIEIPFGQTTLIPLLPSQVYELALLLFSQTLYTGRAYEEAKAFCNALEQLATYRKSNRDLTNTPLLFTMMAALWLRHPELPVKERLPTRPSLLYGACVDLMLTVWTRKDSVDGKSVADHLGVTSEELREALEQVAYEVLNTGEMLTEGDDSGMVTFKWDTLVEALEDVRGAESIPRYREALNFLEQRASLLISVVASLKPRVYRFTHLSFQEHLAAVYLSKTGRYPGQIIDCLTEQPGRWINVVPLLADEVAVRGGDLTTLVKALITPIPDVNQSPDHPQWEAVEHAHDIVSDHRLSLPYSETQQLRRWLEMVVKAGTLNPVKRAVIGRTLSRMGDQRNGVGLKNGLPDIAWKVIPRVQGWRMVDNDGKEYGRFDIPSFRIAKHPVTFLQFQPFLDDPSGWHDPRWWSGLAAYDEHRLAPGKQVFGYDNHPRERVSWWDAMAFCAWLSAQMGHPTLYEWLEAGKDWPSYPGVRLPTEWEWQWAAQGPDGRKYPYEGLFDAAKGNTLETGIGQTSAVGIFPQGASPFGVLDMSGNVWEWCLNEYYNPGQMRLGGPKGRVFRGGSWNEMRGRVHVDDHYGIAPGARSHNLGFRVCELYTS